MKKLTATEWLEEINDGLNYRRLYGMEDAWNSLEQTFYNVDQAERRAAGPNLIASTGDSMLSALMVSYPYFNVKPRRGEFIDSAGLVESIDNWLLTELKIPQAMERSINHAYLWGKGILKIGYDSQFGYDSRNDIDKGMGLTLTQFDKKGRWIENGKNDPGMPWVSSVLPHDVVVPWGTTDLNDAAWLAHRVVRHINDIKSDPKYKKATGLKPQMSLQDFTESYTKTSKIYNIGQNLTRPNGDRKNAEYVEMYEIHFKKDRKILVVAPGYERFLRETVNELQLDGLPFVDLSFVPRTRAFWTTPDAYYLKNAQAEMDDIALQAATQRRISVVKFLYQKGSIKEEDLERALSSDTGIGIGVEPGTPIKEAIAMMHNENQSSLYQDAEVIRRNAREIAGLSRNQGGEFEGGRKTAEEVRTVDRGSMSRLSRRQNILRLAYQDVIKKINQIIFKFWKQPRIIEYVGQDEVQKWLEYTGESIRGDYSYEIVFGDEILPTQGNDKNETLQMYAQLASDPNIDPIELRQYLAASSNDPSFKKLFKVQQVQKGQEQNAPLPI